LSAECASERILKVDQLLAKIWAKVKCHVFMDHPVVPDVVNESEEEHVVCINFTRATEARTQLLQTKN